MNRLLTLLTLVFGCFFSCAQSSKNQTKMSKMEIEKLSSIPDVAVATFGNGCFWCTEAVMESLEGVHGAVSGYMGGTTKNPTYKDVCTGTTNHAEVVRVFYDPKKISYTDLLQAFFRSHDPTSLNKQGGDIGTQYRSVIFYHDQEQKDIADTIIAELTKAEAYSKPIVTEVTKVQEYYVAEDYHQSYFENNPEQAYCAAVVAPKVEKFKSVFKDKLKK